jgi:hypothetical protein
MRTTSALALRHRPLETGEHLLPNPLSLEYCNGREQMHLEAYRRCRRVDAFRKTDERHPCRVIRGMNPASAPRR